jgi:predicted transcriptional regulator
MGTAFPAPRELRALWQAWREGTVTGVDVAGLYEVVDAQRTAYYVLASLWRKGWLVRHEHGYSPAMTREQAAALLTGGTQWS